jgi:hypothetical protein
MEIVVRSYCPDNGWAVDADPHNNPTYPMRDRSMGEEAGYNWERPAQQPLEVEVLTSIERPNITSVFGTSTPPSGLSGALRRFAFRYGESSYGHWLPLMLADRVNEVEGVLDDLSHLHVPNIFAERGWRAEWTFARRRLLARVGAKAAVAAGLGALTYLTTRTNAADARSITERTAEDLESPFLVLVGDVPESETEVQTQGAPAPGTGVPKGPGLRQGLRPGLEEVQPPGMALPEDRLAA